MILFSWARRRKLLFSYNGVNISLQYFMNFRKLTKKMRYLNVAEKNDAAKNIANNLSRGTSRRREGLSPYNKIYEFEAEVMGQKSDMVMTSVSGHLLALEFNAAYKSWQSCNPLLLFEAPVYKYCPENYQNIKKTLEREIKKCQGLIIWTDCDREGENIGFEIIEVCSAVKTNLSVYRAKFSEITGVSVRRALADLGRPDKNVSDAVDVRQELDLRIGAAFTRFQTLRLQRVFPTTLADNLVSYGSCQFPTLGFVVERYRAVENFVPEQFWKIKLNHTVGDLSVDLSWERGRLFDELACRVLLDLCLETPRATVVSVNTKPKSKWRPLPLDTVELEKLGSRKLKINAKETMRIAEKLYTQGLISYPRTETNEYPKEMNLTQLVSHQTADNNWGAFAQRILDNGGPTPRQGNKSDKAHPPIHPTKYANNLTGNEQRLYELIVRSFLACVSRDAQGRETTATAEVGGERFTASGLAVLERNYLDVYPYDKWSSKEIHLYECGQTFDPTKIEMVDGSTSPPHLLTEADLIALMEKHGIGTDATHAEHIETIKSRSYVALSNQIHFVPGLLGMGLVEGYDAMGLAVAKPDLRAGLEADLKAISEGRRQPELVLAEQIGKYKEVYTTAIAEAVKIDHALAQRLNERPNDAPAVANPDAAPVDLTPVLGCPKCGADMVLRPRKNSDEVFVSCTSYPQCKNAVWFPTVVRRAEVTREHCPHCGPNYKLLQFTWRNNSIDHLYPPPYKGCIGGCDETFLDILKINPSSVKQVANDVRTLNRNQNVNNVPLNRNQNVNRDTTVSRTMNNQNVQTLNTGQGSGGVGAVGAVVNTASAARARQSGVGARQSGDDEVTCGCNQHAVLLTVRKQNANFGKKFYKCARGKENGGCDFFVWAPESAAAASPEVGAGAAVGAARGWGLASSEQPRTRAGGEIQCNCHLPCRRFTVQKDGPNKGREFYGCPKDSSSRCDFFDWAEGSTTTVEWGAAGGGGGGGGSYRARGARGGGRATAGGGARGGPRKCGHCRQEGHTRNKCPALND